MKAIWISMVLCLVCLPLAAANRADTLQTIELGRPVETLTYHVRLETKAGKPLKFTLLWNGHADGSRCGVHVEARPVAEADGAGRSTCIYRVFTDNAAGTDVVREGEGLFCYGTGRNTAFSAVLNVDATGAELSLGGVEPEIRMPVPFDRLKPGSLGLLRPSDAKLTVHTLITRQTEPRRRASFATVDSLATYLAASADPLEGRWEYLDRDTDPAKVSAGGRYVVATVADGNGGYDIVYLGGAETFGDDWAPLDVKGRLVPTPFIDHFDLEWIAADSRTLRSETSADFMSGRAVLRLNFPLLNSSIRFRRSR